MNEEEAEIAEIISGKPLGRFDLLGRGRKSAAFPLHPGDEDLAISTSACSATSAVKFFGGALIIGHSPGGLLNVAFRGAKFKE